ncbi:MAG: two-component hybrid sensor and regulator [Vampirovibrio sp.]|jgi:PAS domain S-box-containing protein|nr:two-component hybrid sensor and regulator [Vampirovibrio sp.]
MAIATQSDNTYFQAVFNQKSFGVVVIDKDGRFLRANQKYCQIVGYTEEELWKLRHVDITYPDDLTWSNQCMHRLLSAELETFETEKRYIRKDKAIIWVAVSGSLISPDNSEPTGLFLVQDITARKQAEHENEEAQQRFRTVYDSSLVGILFWNTDGYILDANDALLNMLGYSCDDITNRRLKWTEITPPEFAPLDEAVYQQLIGGEAMVPYEKQYIHKDGHILDILIRSAMLKDSTSIGLACVLDITQQKKAEAERERYAAKLSQSNQDLEQFATIISHDLQAPLRKIMIFSDAIQSKDGAALSLEGLDYLERISRSAQKMQELINALLDISRVHRKGRPFEPVCLDTVAHEAADNLIYLARQTHGVIEFNHVDITLEADPIQLRQLLQNLIENALKFHRPQVEPVVKVSASVEPPNTCHIRVEDNGVGFDEKYIDRIFNIFERLNSKTGFEGIGVGLSLCKKVAERHNGAIVIHSQPGKGSTFEVVLPLRQ